MKVSIILPVFNCADQLAEGLATLIPFLQAAEHRYEIIIVDDGSKDGTDVMNIAREHGCLYLKNELNLGKGATVKKGILSASGDWLIFMDGDFPFDISAVRDMIQALADAGRDVVIGDRTHAQSQYPENLDSYRKLGSKMLSFVICNFYIYGFKDTQCGIKGFTARAGKLIFEKLTVNGFAFDVELLFIAKTNGLRIDKIPVQVLDQKATSVNVVRDGMLMLYNLIRLSVNKLTGTYKIDE